MAGRTRQKNKTVTLTAVDIEILQLVSEYHFLTVAQLVRLRYSPGSETTAQDRLKRLSDAGYLLRRKLPHVGTGNTEYLYYLARDGQKTLQEIGLMSFSRVRKDDVEWMKLPHLEHLLALNDFLIAGRLLSQSVPEITLVEMKHDLELKRVPVKVSYDCLINGSGRTHETVTVIPDAWCDFRYTLGDGSKEKRRCLVIELDRGTMAQPDMRRKFRAYCQYAVSDYYVKLFGTDLIMVAYVTTAGEHRMHQLLFWCEQELQLQQLEDEQNLFRFGVLPASLNSREIFLTPNFSKPLESTPVSLLWHLSP